VNRLANISMIGIFLRKKQQLRLNWKSIVCYCYKI